MEVVLNGRFETKVRVTCTPTTTIRQLKEEAVKKQSDLSIDKMTIRKWWTTLQDDKTLQYYKIGNGDGLDLYT